MIESIVMLLLTVGCVVGAICGSFVSAMVMFPAYRISKNMDQDQPDNVINYQNS